MKLLEDTQNEHERLDRHSLNLLAVTGPIENGLIILLHRGEFLRSDVELGRDDLFRIGHRIPDGVIEIVDIHKLITVLPAADHREAVPGIRPVVK